MKKRKSSVVCVAAFAFCALAGTAYAVTVDPDGGTPGSSYTAEVACSSEPTVYAVDLEAVPAATIVPKSGTESSPGTWTYDLKAGQFDQMVLSSCGSEQEQTRYDVDAPGLFPGPTVDLYGDWDPELNGSSVVGTDCPAGTTASVTLIGDGGYSDTRTAAIDQYGNWEVPIPESAPGEVTAQATCGDLDYEPIVIHRWSQSPDATTPGTETTVSSTDSTSATSVPTPSAESSPSAARPLPGSPTYTG